MLFLAASSNLSTNSLVAVMREILSSLSAFERVGFAGDGPALVDAQDLHFGGGSDSGAAAANNWRVHRLDAEADVGRPSLRVAAADGVVEEAGKGAVLPRGLGGGAVDHVDEAVGVDYDGRTHVDLGGDSGQGRHGEVIQ